MDRLTQSGKLLDDLVYRPTPLDNAIAKLSAYEDLGTVEELAALLGEAGRLRGLLDKAINHIPKICQLCAHRHLEVEEEPCAGCNAINDNWEWSEPVDPFGKE